ncbi:hypothetical protein A3J91_00795 [Candidatus Peribacteria bacterium RIFOXYC2_FULL_58_10]|nr:MAG: hypothetical protein A3J91_00795 [Candidatus Peribacteria bacterium RIFOXYC2_FULL_58_10]
MRRSSLCGAKVDFLLRSSVRYWISSWARQAYASPYSWLGGLWVSVAHAIGGQMARLRELALFLQEIVLQRGKIMMETGSMRYSSPCGCAVV